MKEMEDEKIVSEFRKAVQDFLVPELREAVGELKQMNKRLASVENSIFELRADIREDKRKYFKKLMIHMKKREKSLSKKSEKHFSAHPANKISNKLQKTKESKAERHLKSILEAHPGISSSPLLNFVRISPPFLR